MNTGREGTVGAIVRQKAEVKKILRLAGHLTTATASDFPRHVNAVIPTTVIVSVDDRYYSRRTMKGSADLVPLPEICAMTSCGLRL